MPPQSASPPPPPAPPDAKLSEAHSEASKQTLPAHDDPASLSGEARKNWLLSPASSLPILVVVDMFAVSLVVPLLFQYLKSAGVNSAGQRELLSSVYSASQIFGGLLTGALVDSGYFHRRTVLLISFAGSALSYGLLMYGEFWAIVFSRVLVGLVKQTMTVTTTMIAWYTTKEDRARHIGRLRASATVAWIVGPSVGAFLYKNVDERAPPLLACSLFMLNMVLALVLLPGGEGLRDDEKPSSEETDCGKFSSFLCNLRACFSSKTVGSLIASQLIVTWMIRATSYASMASYYEQFYQIEPHQRGYLSSYQQTLNFIVQSVLIGPFLRLIGGERRAAVLSASLLAAATWMELQATLSLYLVFLAPMISVAVATMNLSLHSLVTHVAPKKSLASVFAALDVLQNAAAVTVPFYRRQLFSLMEPCSDAAMKGDPDPRSWILSSALHWCVATVVMAGLLLTPSGRPKIDRQKKVV